EMLEERKPKSWLKSVSAFANGVGGILFFGISNDDLLVGLDDAKGASEKISEAIKSKMDPVPQTVLEIHTEGGKEFVVLKVLSGQETPYYYTGDGNRVSYVRIGNESVPASAMDLKRLVLRGSNTSFDSLSSRYPFEALAFTKLRSVYRMKTGTELTDSDFSSFELVDEAGMLTNAGVLLADDSPMRHSRLFCTRWYGLDKASGIIEALDDKEYSGSLVSLLQNGTEFVKNNTKKRWKKTGSGRVEMPEYPEQAVHEVIVNALIHRDYMEIGSEVHIDIFDDRLEVYSPGGMADGTLIQDQDTDNISSKRRNPIIADVFSRMHLMERRGSGFRKIKGDYRNALNYRVEVEPLFTSTPTSFFVTLYNLNYNVPIEKVLIGSEKVAVENEKVLIASENLLVGFAIDGLAVNKNTKENMRKLFAHLSFDGIFGRNDIMEILSISITAAGNLINKLKEAGLIEAVRGQGKGKYRFVNQ
ncbi:MAG TPA: ATP-binding protein, partial [Clostridiales bacterium]|nr:ATP-binding protein [Clostridiales bacterium]